MTPPPARLVGARASRRAEHLAGRRCADRALALAGSPHAVDLDERVPRWPRGYVGSIAHSRAIAWSVVARANEARSIGVDIERITTAPLEACLGDDYDARLLATALSATVVFSAKEALFKCLAPLTGVRFDFTDARVVALDRARVDLELTADLGADFVRGARLVARYAVVGDHVFSMVATPPSARAPR